MFLLHGLGSATKGAAIDGLTLKLCGVNEAQRSERPNKRLVSW